MKGFHLEAFRFMQSFVNKQFKIRQYSKMENVFHKGELEVQRLAGEEKMAKRVGRSIQGALMLGANNFMENLPQVIVASKDENNRLWASVLLGKPGIIKVHGTKTFSILLNALESSQNDIFFENIKSNPYIGTLFIEAALRMRYRANGNTSMLDDSIKIEVEEAYGNCPKYIQSSLLTLPKNPEKKGVEKTKGTTLQNEQKTWISKAHTFFLATSSSANRMDASHRGGNPGFVEILDDSTLKIPDYPGNNMFNSLGNIYQNPNAGLLFVDYEAGHIFQLTGRGELQFNGNSSEKDLEKTADTGRFWLFHIDEWVITKNHHHVNWIFKEFSPFNP